MAKLKLFLFGSPRFEDQGSSLDIERRKALALAAYLAISDQAQSRDTVAALLWSDLDQEHARAALRSTLPTLTGLSDAMWLDADRQTLGIHRDQLWVDVREFLALLTASRMHPHASDVLCAECAALLKQAADLYTADFLAGFSLPDSAEFEDWQTFQREWLRREYGGILRRLADYYSAQGNYDQAITFAHRWLALDNLHEPAYRLLMRLYTLNDQRSEALRQYQTCVSVLDSELLTLPEEETTHLYQSILANQLTPIQNVASTPAATSVLPPLPALVIGREEVLAELRQRLGIGGEMRSVTVLQGWPGVGKSTTVAALAHDPQIAAAFPDGVLWASLGEQPSLLAELATWADALNLSEPGSARKLEEITTQLSNALRNKRMLLIVDDVWALEHAAPFKVAGQRCATVFTSRLNDIAQALAPTAMDVYRLPVLTEDTALNLLQMLCPEAVNEHPIESRELVRDVEGLPLAIQVAGRLLHSEARLGWGVGDLLRELREGATILAAQAPSDMLDQNPTSTIAALLKRSTDTLDAAVRDCFAILGVFVPKPATFDLEAMAAAWDVSDPKPIARILVNRGLLEPVSGGRFQMHALLVLHAKSLLEAA
ncbi:MAG: NB-ARC domain-containing protein [Anaerolineae bacterium]